MQGGGGGGPGGGGEVDGVGVLVGVKDGVLDGVFDGVTDTGDFEGVGVGDLVFVGEGVG